MRGSRYSDVRVTFLHARHAPPHPDSRRSERCYVGRRPAATEVYVVTRSDVERLAHRAHRSREAFDWGRESPGAFELAFAVLADTAESEPTDLVCAAFRAEVIARLDNNSFVLGADEIALWLLTAFGEPTDPQAQRPSFSLASLAERARARLCRLRGRRRARRGADA